MVNAYAKVAQAIEAGLLVDEDAIETLCYNAGLKGESLEATLKSVGYWLEDTAAAYWRQGSRDAHVDQATAPEYMVFDRIKARVSITIENLGFSEVSIRCDQFDLTYTVSVWDKTKKCRVPIARAVMLDDILTMVDGWAIETTCHRESSRQLRVLNGFEDFEQVAA